GRLKISPSRRSPRPPSATLPAATPPSGKAIIFSLRPVKTRGKAASLNAAAGPAAFPRSCASPSAGHAPICVAAPTAPAACFKNVRRGSGGFFDIRHPCYEEFKLRRILSVLLHAILYHAR